MLENMVTTEEQDVQGNLAEADQVERAVMAIRMDPLGALVRRVGQVILGVFEADMAVEAEADKRDKVVILKALALNLNEPFEQRS